MTNHIKKTDPRPLVAAFVLAASLGGNAHLYSQAGSTDTGHSRPASAETSRSRPEARRFSEGDRTRVLRALLKQRAELAQAGKMPELRSCDAQIKSHPAPSDGDPVRLTRRLAGKWRSPRHDYLYRADGSWTLLPAEKGTLHGRWRTTGNQLEITSGYAKTESVAKYTLILLTDKEFVYTDGDAVFSNASFGR